MQNRSFVDQLRDRTATHHAKLDAALGFRPGEVTAARYVALLRGTLQVLRAVEPSLTQWLGAESWSRRLSCLREDLAALAVDAETPSVPLIVPRTLAESFGCAYVIEGSALGGMVLAPIIEKDLALDPGRGTSYLRLWGKETAAHWRAFVARLNEFGNTIADAETERACDMACATFENYERVLSAQGAMQA